MPRLWNIATLGVICLVLVGVGAFQFAHVQRDERVNDAIIQGPKTKTRMFDLLHVPQPVEGEVAQVIVAPAFSGPGAYVITGGTNPTFEVRRHRGQRFSDAIISQCQSDLRPGDVQRFMDAVEESGILHHQTDEFRLEDGVWIGVRISNTSSSFGYGNNWPEDPVYGLAEAAIGICPAACIGVCRAVRDS